MAKNKKAQDGTALPRSLDPRYKAAVVADKQRVEFEKAKAKQPSLSSGKPANIEETKRRNKAYAKKQGLGYDEASGRVYDPISPQTSKTLEAAYENIVEPMMMLEGAGALSAPLKMAAKQALKKSMESGLLSQTYKLNPWAFKPNEVNWYRQVGKSAIDDAFETGLIREAREEVSPRMFQEFQDQLIRMQGSGPEAMLASRRPASPFFGKGELFYPMSRKPIITKSGKISKNPAGKGSADYLIETALPNESFQPAYVRGMSLGVPTEVGSTAILKPDPSLRNLENFNLYQKDWLRGYKQIKQQGGSVESYMGGLTDKGFNYNGAWGGTMQMGGNLPGAVGNMYSRDGAPSNGKYAKKTKASAQNGAKIPVIEDAGSFNKEGVWIPDWEKMTAQAKKLGAKKVRTKHGSVIYFNDKWEVSSVNDNPDEKAQNGKNLSYNQWKKQYNLKETPDYNLKRAWELGYTPDKTGHLPTVDDQTGQFLKAKGHPTIQLELDWYNSPEGAEFRSKNKIDSSGKYYKYVPKGAEGMEILPDPTDPERKYKLSATIASAKDILNPLLRAKDPSKYDAWNKGRLEALRKGMPVMRDYMEKNPIDIYLSPQEVKSALSKQREGFYEDYLGAIRGLKDYESELGTPMRETLYGGKEGKGELENLNYGWRFATLPVNVARNVTVGGKPVPEESFIYSYNPAKDEYKKDPYYKNGGKMMSYYQAGLDFEPKTISKKGSKIKKDNDGYWNPENWGKPVEIDSNEITMQGVYQPLLGISDTGDVQMMYPGEDYEFDGESVTEYPVAQNGVGIPKEIYLKQLYKESRFNPKAISPLGEDTGKGIAQISKSTYNDFLKATKYKPEQIDLMNPEHSAAVQRWAMNDLYNSEFINKPNQSPEVRLAKTLAAYNYGRGNLSDALVAAKEKGMDIYNSLDWINSLPKQTSDYINKIQLKKDDKFEKEYSEAVKKSPYTKYYESGGNINQLDEAPLKKLDDLLNFTNMGKKRNIKKGQMGIASVSPTTLDLSMNRAMATAPTKLPTTPPPSVAQSFTPPNMQQMTVPSSQTADTATAALLGGSKAAQWYSQIKNAVDERKKAKVFKNVSEIVKEAATSRPDMPKRKYVRPEDNLLSPDQSSFQSFGTGYDILSQAKDGMQIGGNLTEIQNMYTTPGTLYDNLGYEPLEDSQMKQYKKGGDVPKAMAGAIMAVLPQILEKANQAMDAPVNLATSLISRGTKKWTEEGLQNMQQGAYNQSLSNQFGAFMKDGGWVSHDWQPQVITKFGDYTMDQLLTPPNDAEMLRTGGNIRSNYMGDDEKLSMMAMGGNLQTHWGGKGEVMSYNPYSPGSGETVMLRGQSHEETDGRGNSGIGMSYGGNMVEAERGEPVAEMQEGGAVGDTSAVVFGNMEFPNAFVDEMKEDVKRKKFKNIAANLSKKEAKQNKIVDKATKLVNDTDGDDAFDLLKMNAGMAMLTGADMKLKDLANEKERLATIQNAILSTAEEMGLESDALAKGKIMQAKKGAKIPKGQTGVLLPKDEFDFMSRGYNTPQIDFGEEYSRYLKPMSTNAPAPTAPFTPFEIDLQKGVRNPYAWSSPASSFQKPSNVDNYPLYTMQTEGTPTDSEPVVKLDKKMLRKLTKDNKSDSSKIKDFVNDNEGYIGMGYNELLPYIRPTNKLPLDPFQLMGEQMALATNTLEPVQAQTFKPMLETRAPKMSAQEALNKNQADFNAMARQIGNNPAALSMLAAQKQAADRQTIAQVEATNIQQEMAANNRNIAMLNDATLKNLAILDTQYQRQAGAKANTKAQAQAALNSIASKIGQNKLENFQSGVMQNMYNYRFGPQGRIINYNPLAQFNTSQYEEVLTEDKAKEIEKQTNKKVTRSKNGSIVKAIKNL